MENVVISSQIGEFIKIRIKSSLKIPAKMTGVANIHSNLVHNALKYKEIAFLINFLENQKKSEK